MVKSAAKKVMWVGRATVYMVGLAVILVLTVGVASAAFGADGGNFILGQSNSATAITKLAGSAGVAGPSLQIDNNSTSPAATALDLQVEPGKAPMTVNSSTEVQNLNADLVNGKSASDFLGRFEAASNSNLLDGKDSTAFARGVNGKATDADKLDGRDSTAFVGATRPMSVVAAGTIAPDGSVLEATSNVTVRKSATGRYLIDISGVSNYIFSDFVALATAVSNDRVARTTSFSGDLLVVTEDQEGTEADGFFTFVVYDAG
jgi:hypothetical protein